jgi:peptidoglycan/LPS O-acetylase OafA/YrhL
VSTTPIERGGDTQFLPQIQALRAIAVGLVVVYHFWPGSITGGYVGVDVFFVISGFLITSHLLREADRTGKISLPGFYARRARRLLPASLLVLAVTAVATFFILPVTRWGVAFFDILSSAFYAENWVLAARSVDYLAAGAAASPVQHYWSLSTEEQFYLVWPLLVVAGLVAARRFNVSMRNAVYVILGVAVVASFIYGVWLTVEDRNVAYFSTFTRAWEFGMGGLLARSGFSMKQNSRLAPFVSWGGVALIAAAAVLLDDQSGFPGWVALAPVLGAVAVIAAGMPTGWWSPSWIYRLRPVGFLGDISYSLYLWHWPVVVLAPFVLVGNQFTIWEGLACIAVLLVVSWLSRILVEDPVRRARILVSARPRRTLLVALASMATVAVLAVSGGVAYESRLIAARATVTHPEPVPTNPGDPFPPIAIDDGQLHPDPIVASEDWSWDKKCWSVQESAKITKCSFGKDNTGPRVALIGDSHVGSLFNMFTALAERRGWKLDVYIKQACSWSDYGPMLKNSAGFAENCTTWRRDIQPVVKKKHYDIVFTTSAVYRVKASNTAAGLADAWKPIVADGTQVYVLLDNPRFPGGSPNDCLIENPSNTEKCAVSRDEAFPWKDPQIAAAAMVPEVHVIDLRDKYCDETKCFAALDGFTLYKDEEHFTGTYAMSLMRYFDAAIEDYKRE